jgi:hypothetical protein
MTPPNEQELRERVSMLIGEDTDAAKFVRAFGSWCHAIDDVVDGETKDSEGIIKAFMLPAAIFSSNFYQQNIQALFPIVMLIANAYADSVQWEKSCEEWKARQSDVLRNCGNEMLLAVIGICRGYEAMRQVSQMIRENSHYRHHDEDGKAI